jgi:hypothetical protein
MSFFMWHLTHDHWQTPWTFILVILPSKNAPKSLRPSRDLLVLT